MSDIGWWEYVSLVLVTAAATLVGLYHVYTARHITDPRQFLFSSKQIGLAPLVLSVVATVFSAVSLLGFSAEAYMNGANFFTILIANFISFLIATYFYLPVFYRLNKNTIFEYLELRFNKMVKMIVTVMICLQMLFHSALVIYAPSLVLNQVTGIHLWTSVASIGAVCAIYTSLGGFRAVVWADVTQCFIIAISLFLIVIRGTVDLGGLKVLWERLEQSNRSQIFIWSWSPYSLYSFWTLAFGAVIQQTTFYVVSQAMMQRYLSCKTLKKSQIAMISGLSAVTFGHFLFIYLGLLIFAFYYDCDPKMGGSVRSRDQLLVLFAVKSLSFCRGLTGVFIAGIMCATLSTLSSVLNALAAVTINDFVAIYKPNLSNKTTINLSRVLVLVYGGLCMLLVILAENMGTIVKAGYAMFSLTSAPVFIVFTIGMLLPCVNNKGAIAGLVGSIVLPLWATLGNMITKPALPHAPLRTDGCINLSLGPSTTNITLHFPNATHSGLKYFYSLSPMWYPCWGMLMGVAMALLVSKITGFRSSSEMDPDLFFSFVSKYLRKTTNSIKLVPIVSSPLIESPLSDEKCPK